MTRRKHLFIIGQRGIGKTTLAKQLSHELSRSVIHLDDEITKKIDTPISDYVSSYGWNAFRLIESACLRAAVRKPTSIIDTGGGITDRKCNWFIMIKFGEILWLDAPQRDIINFLRNRDDDKQRPAW